MNFQSIWYLFAFSSSGPVFRCLDQFADGVTGKAPTVVYGDHLPASGAAVLPGLFFQESFLTVLVDAFQIFQSADAVILPVPGIHALDLRAGVLPALKAVDHPG